MNKKIAPDTQNTLRVLNSVLFEVVVLWFLFISKVFLFCYAEQQWGRSVSLVDSAVDGDLCYWLEVD